MTFRIIDLGDGEVFESHDLERDADDFFYSCHPWGFESRHPTSFHWTPLDRFEDEPRIILNVV